MYTHLITPKFYFGGKDICLNIIEDSQFYAFLEVTSKHRHIKLFKNGYIDTFGNVQGLTL